MTTLNVVQAFENALHKYRDVWQNNDQLSREISSALCNMQWAHEDYEEEYSCSWRYAGDLVASLRSCGENYIDFYCSGWEGVVTEGVFDILLEEGWLPVSYDDEPIEIVPEIEYSDFEISEESIAKFKQLIEGLK